MRYVLWIQITWSKALAGDVCWMVLAYPYVLWIEITWSKASAGDVCWMVLAYPYVLWIKITWSKALAGDVCWMGCISLSLFAIYYHDNRYLVYISSLFKADKQVTFLRVNNMVNIS